jgi:hypothetical protein
MTPTIAAISKAATYDGAFTAPFWQWGARPLPDFIYCPTQALPIGADTHRKRDRSIRPCAGSWSVQLLAPDLTLPSRQAVAWGVMLFGPTFSGQYQCAVTRAGDEAGASRDDVRSDIGLQRIGSLL